MTTGITLEELKLAWEHRMLALRLERSGHSTWEPQYKAHIAHWTRAVARIPGRGKLQWVTRPGEPPHSRAQDCIVQGVIYLEWHP